MIRVFILCTCVVGVWNLRVDKKVDQCGREASSNLIHHNPWLVYLEFWRDDQRLDNRCAATLVDCQHLITAAHCVRTPKFSRIVARLGEYDLTKQEDCVDSVCADPILRIDIKDIVVHPGYDGSSHDIAVLRLTEQAPYTDFIRPICLPSGELQKDVILTASGWGGIPFKRLYTSVKKIILLPLWDKAACEAAYKNQNLPTNIICAGGEEGIDTCRGDSGGPLVWIKDRTELWGVTSAGYSKCGTKGYPGIYTSVVDHLDWITEAVAD